MTDRNSPPFDSYQVYGRAQRAQRGGDDGYGHEPPRQRSTLLSVLLYLALGVVVLIVGGITFLMVAPPTDAIRRQIISQVKAQTGRDLSINGPTSFTFYPELGLSMQQVALSAPPTMGGKPLVTMGALDVSVRLLPLLSREIAVDKLVLHQPVFELRVDKAGRKSWDFAAAPSPVRFATAGSVDVAQFVSPAAAQAGGLPAELKQIALGEVRIENGTVRYSDEAAGTRQEVKAIDASFGLKSIASPFEVNGSFDWSGEKLAFSSVLTTPQTLLENRPVKLAFNLNGRPVSASYDGSLTLADVPTLEGSIKANAASLRALATWLGTQLPPAKGFGPLEINGRIKTAAKTVTFSDANFMLDGATATGKVSIDSSGARPYINATLGISELDLNKYISSDGAVTAPAPTPAARSPQQTAPSGRDAIDDLLNRQPQSPGTRVKGYTQRSGWSEAPIDVASLGLVDADAKVTVGRLLYQNLKVGQSALTFQLKNKVMKTTFDDVALYNGKGKGFVTLDGTQSQAKLGANFSLDGIAAQPLLKDAADLDWLAGTGQLTMAISGQGASERQIVQTLNGKSSFTFTEGAIVGINIPQAIRGLTQGKLESLDLVPSEKTDFSEMSASFAITNGIAESTDLKMLSPLLRVGGAGKVMLPEREVDYTIRPKLVANLQGQGGEQGASGLEIPVRISGSWDNPEIAPDIAGILKDPGQVGEAIKDIGKQMKGKNAGEIVNDLLGKGKDGQPSKAQQFLDKFFKQ